MDKFIRLKRKGIFNKEDFIKALDRITVDSDNMLKVFKKIDSYIKSDIFYNQLYENMIQCLIGKDFVIERDLNMCTLQLPIDIYTPVQIYPTVSIDSQLYIDVISDYVSIKFLNKDYNKNIDDLLDAASLSLNDIEVHIIHDKLSIYTSFTTQEGILYDKIMDIMSDINNVMKR